MALLVYLTACGASPPSDLGAQPAAPLPTYGLGDSYQFSDGSSDTVVSVVGDVVRWQSKNGTFTTARDVLLPRIAWSNSQGTGERRFALGPVELFPLERGKGVKFSATRSVTLRHRRPVTVQEAWRCDVAGATITATQAGKFDTWRVDCTMHETPPLTGSGVVERSFYYAPAIGYYVRSEEREGGGPLHVAELTSYTTTDPVLPQSALRQRSVQLQHALESQPSGSQATWSDTRSGDAGRVLMVDTRQSERYGWCRDFAENIRSSGRIYALHGIGCRNPARVWNIVMLASGTGGPLRE